MPARVRSEWSRLRMKGIGSVWAPASQDSSHVGHAGVGVVSLKGAPLSLPTISTTAFRTYVALGRAVRCLLPLEFGRLMHLVVLYGYQGSATSSEQLQLIYQLIDAALSELAVVAKGQPCLVVGDFNVEPMKIPSLAQGISAGLWVDLGSSWAFALEREPAVTCKRTWESDSGNRRDFQIGCPCVLRQFGPVVFHLIVGYNHILLLGLGLLRKGGLPRSPSLLDSPSSLWPASWLSAVDISRDSKSAEVRRVWEIFDESLQLIDAEDVFRLNDALQGGDVSQARLVWYHAAEVAEAALVDAYRLAGGPEPDRGVKLGRGAARFSVGGPKMRSAHARCAGPGDSAQVDLYRDNSIVPLIDLRRRLRSGYSLARGLELTRQWGKVLRCGPLGTVSEERLRTVSGLQLPGFGVEVGLTHDELHKFLHDIVVRRKDCAVRGWRAWILEDQLVHPYRWLRPDLVPPSPFLQCDPASTVDGLGVLSDPSLIDRKFREAWLPHFCRSVRGVADLEDFSMEVEGGLVTHFGYGGSPTAYK